MEIIKNFGINPMLLGAQIVNFLVILFLLRKFLYKPLLKLLEDRKNTVAQGVENAKKAELLLEEAGEKEKAILRNAQEEAKKMLNQAKIQHENLLKQAQDLAKKQTETIIEEARAQIAFEQKLAEKNLATNISDLAIVFLEKSLRNFFTPKEQSFVIKNTLKKIKDKN